MPKRAVRGFLAGVRDKPGTPAELRETLEIMDKESDEILRQMVGKALVEIHKHGVLIPWLLEWGVLVRREDEEEE